jgi:hypothetical protein
MPRTGSCARTRTPAKLLALTKTDGFRAIANANASTRRLRWSTLAAITQNLRRPAMRDGGPFQNPAGRLATETADFCNKIAQ